MPVGKAPTAIQSALLTGAERLMSRATGETVRMVVLDGDSKADRRTILAVMESGREVVLNRREALAAAKEVG